VPSHALSEASRLASSVHRDACCCTFPPAGSWRLLTEEQLSAPNRRLTASFAPKTDAAIAFDGSFLVKAGEDLPSF